VVNPINNFKHVRTFFWLAGTITSGKWRVQTNAGRVCAGAMSDGNEQDGG